MAYFGPSTLTPGNPGGRLTLSSTLAISLATIAAAATLYYLPFRHSKISLYNGSAWLEYDIGAAGLSNVLANSATGKAGPAAVANNSNYDYFVWDDAGTVRLTRGPLWSSGTARGTGAGTTELEQVNGVWVNKIAITNGPAAQRGRYVGSVRSNGTATVDLIIPSAAGTAGFVGLWNNYNRTLLDLRASESTVSWSYLTSAWRAANNTSIVRVSWILGLAEDFVSCMHRNVGGFSSSVNFGPGYDWSSGAPTVQGTLSTQPVAVDVIEDNRCDLGFHYFQGLENGLGVATATWYGTPYTYLKVRVSY